MYYGFWYQEALEQDDTVSPSLVGDCKVDVCIIGGGFLGLWSAIRLKQANPEMHIAIIERDRCGSGASGRNGGLATNWWAKFLSLSKICGEVEARRICVAAESAIDEIGDFCKTYDIDAQYRKEGWLWTASNKKQIDSWLVLTKQLEKYNLNPFQILSPAEIQKRTGSPRTIAGIFDPNAATVQPAMLARGLRRVALSLGVEIFEYTPLVKLERSKTPVVYTNNGKIIADKVVIAMNAWGAQFPELRRMITLMSSDMVATAPAKKELDEIGLSGGEGITDSRTLLNYWRNTPQGRIIFGKPLGQFGFAGHIGDLYDRPSPVAEKVEQEFRSFYPKLNDVPIISNWTGPIDRTLKGIPNFGRLGGHPNIFYGIGFSGNGVGTTVFASRIIKSLVEGNNDEWSHCGLVEQKIKLFPPDPFCFIGAHLVRNALVKKEAKEDLDQEPGWIVRSLASLAPAGYVPQENDVK